MKILNFALVFALFLSASIGYSQNVGINADGSAPDGSAMLDVKSTSKGILIPRMTATQKTEILNPVAGLMIYQTDATAGFYFWNGSAWTQIGAGGGSGTVTSIATGTGLTGGTITTTGTIALASSGVTAGSYTRASITVDSYGRITVAGNGAAIDLTSDVTGVLPIANGGTGQSTTSGAINAILPTQTGNSGNYLSTNGTTASWQSVSGNPTGAIIQFAGSISPTGYLMCNGAAVSRTTYANLFAVIGTTYGAGDGSTTFNLPNLQGKVPVGKSSETEFDVLGETGGEKTHTITTAQMPSHTHTFSGTAHTHIFTANAHTHTFTGGSHSHGINDPGHDHQLKFAHSGSGNYIDTDDSNSASDFEYSTASCLDATTGITINSSTVTGSNANTTVTGSNANATAGGTNSNTGSGTSMNVIQPYLVLNYIIKY